MKRVLPLCALVVACSSNPPPHWADGGAGLALGRARWDRGESNVDLGADGRVLVDGDLVLTLDRAGRIYDDDHDPVAVLQPDGALIGKDDKPLGQIGTATAAPPGVTTAWIGIADDGRVTRFDPEGDRHPVGVFQGCGGEMIRTCLLVAHVVSLREAHDRPRFGFGFGVGIH